MHIDFRKMRLFTVAADISACPKDGLPEIVLAGRSNSGKSSLINALAGRKDLARTSSAPGKTRLVVYFGVDGALLIADLPGYGFAQASKADIKAFSGLADNYFQSGRKISLALVLMDIRHTPSQSDWTMLDFLRDRSIPFLPVFTKSDKFSRAQAARRYAEQREWLASNGFGSESIAVSTQSREGIDSLASAISELLEYQKNGSE